MFVQSENEEAAKSEYPRLGSFADLEQMGIKVEHTSRTIACTELVSKFPFALTWENADTKKMCRAKKYSDNEYRYVFGDGFLNDDCPRYFSVCYFG